MDYAFYLAVFSRRFRRGNISTQGAGPLPGIEDPHSAVPFLPIRKSCYMIIWIELNKSCLLYFGNVFHGCTWRIHSSGGFRIVRTLHILNNGLEFIPSRGPASSCIRLPHFLPSNLNSIVTRLIKQGKTFDTPGRNGRHHTYLRTSLRHVGHVCCLWNQLRKQAAWKMWLQGNFLFPAPVISSRQMMQTLSANTSSSSEASGYLETLNNNEWKWKKQMNETLILAQEQDINARLQQT